MRIYNTLSRTVEEFRPISQTEVKVYTCGPTVYDYQHIGNWFTYIRYDLLKRVLSSNGFSVKWVLNITDVGHLVSDADEGEDKLEKGARREGKTAWDVAKFYTEDFLEGLKSLNIEPSLLPRATDNIKEQINLIQRLEALGYTYTIDDGVYYDTSKFDNYSELAKLDVENLEAGKRVTFNENKRNSTDFALWKFSPKDKSRDMEWESPWGRGFPGWHIECSAMILKYLGETIDIHGGGIDHIPLHHTNEIAQSEAANGKSLANYWFHTNHILVDDEKISKSLRNGITIQDLKEKGYSTQDLRLLALESHYRTQSKFGYSELDAASKRLLGYQNMAALIHQPKEVTPLGKEFFADKLQSINKHLNEDLNSPLALMELSQMENVLSSNLIAKEDVSSYKKFLEEIDMLLGFDFANVKDISDDSKALLKDREAAKHNKAWDESDKLRDQLTKQSLGVRDTPHGQIWYRL